MLNWAERQMSRSSENRQLALTAIESALIAFDEKDSERATEWLYSCDSLDDSEKQTLKEAIRQENEAKKEQPVAPQVFRITPANNAKNVDYNIDKIVVVFDRPMCRQSMAFCGMPQDTLGNEYFGFDVTGKVFTVPVKLKLGKKYRFYLNTSQFFMSMDGIVLEPCSYTFTTKVRSNNE